MKQEQLYISGATSVPGLLGSCAVKLAWNHHKGRNAHLVFCADPVDYDLIARMALALSARDSVDVRFDVHFFEMPYTSEIELHPLSDSLVKSGHTIASIFETSATRLETWRRVVGFCRPEQKTVFGSRISDVILPWVHNGDLSAALVRSADAAIDGTFDGLASGARAVCEPFGWSQAKSIEFVTIMTAAGGGGMFTVAQGSP